MPSKRPPSVRARKLAAEIRHLREAKRLTGEEVATRLGWSASKISRIETARSTVSVSDLRQLLELYELPGSRHDRLIELARASGQRGWWDAFDDSVREGYAAMIQLENQAGSMFSYQDSVIPGLLQTEAYAEAIIRSSLLSVPPGVVSQRVEIRLRRQAALSLSRKDQDPLEMTAVLDEAVLRRQTGGAEVMREQLLHLVDMAEQPNITLQVLPFAKGSHPAMTGAFTILTFPDSADSGVVFLENMTSDIFVENEAEVHQHHLVFDRLREISLEPQQSVSFIGQIAAS